MRRPKSDQLLRRKPRGGRRQLCARQRLGGIGAAVMCAVSLMGPATALAVEEPIVNGTLYTEAWGPRHSLSSVWATWYQYDWACANAWNADGSGWAGQSVCAAGHDTNVGHLYCACRLRYGYAYVHGYEFGHKARGYWRQFW